MKRWIYFQPLKWREHHLMNFLVYQVMADGFRRSDVSAIPKLIDAGEQSSPPKTVSQSALADIIDHFLTEKADRLSVFGQPRVHSELCRRKEIFSTDDVRCSSGQ